MAQSFSKETANRYREANQAVLDGIMKTIGGLEDLNESFVKEANSEKLTNSEKAALETIINFKETTLKKVGDEIEKAAEFTEKMDRAAN